MAIANALQLEGSQTLPQSFWIVLAHFVLRMRINCYYRASNQNSDIAIRFSDPDFTKKSNTLAIRRRFHPASLTFDLLHLTLNVGCHVIKLCTKCDRNRTIRGQVIDDLANVRCRYVTLWPWPLTPWPWTFVVDRVSCDQTMYQIWAKRNNRRLSYWSFSKFLHIFSPPPL